MVGARFVGQTAAFDGDHGSVLLIVGYGSIGRELARRAKAFSMRVWGVTRSGQGDTTFARKSSPRRN